MFDRLFARHLLCSAVFFEGEGEGGAGGGGAGGDGGGDGGGKGEGGQGADGGGGDGGQQGAWYEAEGLGLDDDTKAYIAGKGWDGFGAMLKSHREVETLATNRNVMPKPEKDKLAEWQGWTELGWTEKLDDYALKRPEIPSGVEYDDGLEDHLRKIAHEARVPVPAAQSLLDGLVGYQKELVDKVTAEGAAAEKKLDEDLRTEWGDKYDEKRELGRRAAEQLGVKVGDAQVLEQVMGSPGLVKMFAQVGELMGEQRLADPKGQGGAMTPAQAQAEINRIEGDEAWMKIFRDARHPQNKDYVAHRQRLYELVAKGQAA